MFDWNAELERAKQQAADLEEGMARVREELRQGQDGTAATPIERMFGERVKRLLSVRTASLERAKFHARFIEHKIAAGARTFETLPYLELAQTCFNSVKGMPDGSAAKSLRAHAAAFYQKAIAERRGSSD